MRTDWLIVGAGLTGCVLAERIANELGQRVLLVEKRRHIAGNAYDLHDEHGVLVHRYGPHIFHTRARHVWDYLSRFAEWRPYYHRVLAQVEGKPVPVPFNLNSIEALLPRHYAESVERALIAEYGFGKKIPILELKRSARGELQELASYIYRNVFEGYTTKQWGLPPEELDGSVTSRVPVHISRDDRYFQDSYQAIPKHGYTAMCQRMLDHPRIRVLLGTPYEEVRDEIECQGLVYTGMIDAFFDYRHGELPYRSVKLDFQYSEEEQHQEVAQINYPNEYGFTRITEFKQLSGQKCNGTTIAVEYPEAYERGRNEAYYPIPMKANQERFNLYREEAEHLEERVLFGGRLADYRYYNMDQAVARALSLFEKKIAAFAVGSDVGKDGARERSRRGVVPGAWDRVPSLGG